jgi:hypothetical protein
MPVLADFIERLALPNPALVLVEAEKYLPAIDLWLKAQIIAPSDRTWILTRLGYFIGEYLVQQLGGCWYLSAIPDSKYFGRYVVGRFARASNPNAMVDPFAVAEVCIADPSGTSLTLIVTSVTKEIAVA